MLREEGTVEVRENNLVTGEEVEELQEANKAMTAFIQKLLAQNKELKDKLFDTERELEALKTEHDHQMQLWCPLYRR